MDHLYQSVNNVPCIATLRPYEEEFPLLVTQTDEKKITRRPYVIPQGITPHGHQATTPQEEVLNWHTDNAVSQNKVLLRIDHTLGTLVEKTEGLSVQISSMEEQVAALKDRLSTQAFQLDQELKTYIDSREDVPTKDKGIKEGSPAPGRSINMISLDNQAYSTETNEESEEETTEISEGTDDWSEEDYKADLSAIAMAAKVCKEFF
ncbi:hypothetical protein Ahy_A08g038392 [Arachis hypogaea]|uniref:Uncharacterized protein n=1 Tax=Arachis hypogaea TaxID=3818 RepID=A0A445BTN0_ARAHY|nr:hypothetical protein Ahy_A08g038392 [Arachis hypogaea]